MDTRTPKKRHEIMSAVRTKNTGPELSARKTLYALGYRYRLHRKGLPGRPDIVFPKLSKVVFIHGCFWHGHKCSKGQLPKSRLTYWGPKIAANKRRDTRNVASLKRLGWKALVVWQCELKESEDFERRVKVFLGPPHRQKKATEKHR